MEGVVAIFNNKKFYARDESGALERRLRQFRADKVVREKKDLIRYSHRTGWEGDLLSEMGRILRWVLEKNEKEVYDFLENYELNCPSMKEDIKSSKCIFTLILEWIEK